MTRPHQFLTAAARFVYRPGTAALEVVRRPAPVLFHVVVVLLSAAIAASLPWLVSFAALKLLAYWSLIEHRARFLIAAEVAVALLLILVFTYVRASWKNRALSKMARVAGMMHFTARRGRLGRRRSRKLKGRQALLRDVMVVGSTGYRTFVNPKGDLHVALQHCREAKVMLLNPGGPGAVERANSILSPDVTPESLREQITQSIQFLKRLKAAGRSVRLKLYPEPPFLKLAIMGDYVWVQYYHPDHDVQGMPEYVFVHDQSPASLYTPFYQYFVTRWNDPAIPEYDLVTDELVYRNGNRREVRREPFSTSGATSSAGA